MKPEAETLAALAGAVTGPETPNAATVTTKAPIGVLWVLILAGPAVSVMLAGVVWVLAFHFWPDVVKWREPDLGGKIILGVSSVGMVLAGLLGLITFRLASGNLKSVRASAGPGSIEITTGDE